jgi:hypothetical protein
VDYYSAVISFTKERPFHDQATALLDQINAKLEEHGFKMGETKTDTA